MTFQVDFPQEEYNSIGQRNKSFKNFSECILSQFQFNHVDELEIVGFKNVNQMYSYDKYLSDEMLSIRSKGEEYFTKGGTKISLNGNYLKTSDTEELKIALRKK